MSRYLRFALHHASAPIPGRITILATGVDWADDQLLGEFRFQFPQSDMNLTSDIQSVTGDLLVLPYLEVLLAEAPVAVWCRDLSSSQVPWVMLYGLDYRRIKVLPARQAISHCWWAIVLHQLERWVAKSHLPGVIRRVRRLRRRLCE